MSIKTFFRDWFMIGDEKGYQLFWQVDAIFKDCYIVRHKSFPLATKAGYDTWIKADDICSYYADELGYQYYRINGITAITRDEWILMRKELFISLHGKQP